MHCIDFVAEIMLSVIDGVSSRIKEVFSSYNHSGFENRCSFFLFLVRGVILKNSPSSFKNKIESRFFCFSYYWFVA